MGDMKDKVKGFMKKVTSSSSGKFKGKGRVLGGSSSSSSSSGPSSHRQNQQASNTKVLSQKPENKQVNKTEAKKDSDGGFHPYGELITSGINPNGYFFECPICGCGFGSEEEVSTHVDSCLGSQVSNLGGELETRVSAYVSGKPSLEVLIKLLNNIVKEPENPKFRQLRMGNPKIKEAIAVVVGGVELLEFVGFELKEEGGEMWAVMDVPSQQQLVMLMNAISLLETNKLPSVSQVKATEPVEPSKINRQIRVFFCVPESVAGKIELPDSFFNLSREELRREAEMRKKKIEDSKLLIPKSYREKQAKAARKKNTKSVIRIQFPDGVLLQGVFLPSEPTSVLYEFVSSALKEPSLEFELLRPVLVKRRVIPHFPAAGERAITLEEDDLVPAALLKFKPIETDSIVFSGLRNELLEISEPLETGSVASHELLARSLVI